MTRLFFGIVVAVTLSAVPAISAPFRADNGVRVTPVGANSFQITKDAGYGARGMWCAAADYAKDVLGVSGSTRIYVIEPRQSARGPVTFGLEPVALDTSNGLGQNIVIIGATLRQSGANLSANHAHVFCWDRRRTLSR